jgi:tRNA threonylcarbamoyladenosine biosynthesis protein TsaE
MKEVVLNNQQESEDFATKLGSKLKGGEVLTFASDLGGGKTTLIKYIVAGSGSNELVSSPTFTICNTYKAKNFTIYHFDFYRLSDPGIMKRELAEVLEDEKTVVLIEWPEIIESVLDKNMVSIQIEVTAENSRKLKLIYPDNLDYLFEGIN